MPVINTHPVSTRRAPWRSTIRPMKGPVSDPTKVPMPLASTSALNDHPRSWLMVGMSTLKVVPVPALKNRLKNAMPTMYQPK